MRHKWVKLRIHVYICRTCGCGRVNAQDLSGRWFATWHLPDGHSIATAKTPECAIGEKTQVYLAKYAAEIAAGTNTKAADEKPAA